MPEIKSNPEAPIDLSRTAVLLIPKAGPGFEKNPVGEKALDRYCFSSKIMIIGNVLSVLLITVN
jgi:hypothetical protein